MKIVIDKKEDPNKIQEASEADELITAIMSKKNKMKVYIYG